MSHHDNVMCDTCGKPFTAQEWDERHWGPDGEEWHEECCPVCQDDQPRHPGATAQTEQEGEGAQ